MKAIQMTRFMLVALLLAVFAGGSGVAAAAKDAPGAVYVLSNSPSGNSVLAFDRAADGSLTPADSFATGGTGTGAGLGSQGAITLSDNNRMLFAVSAGSNQVSAFRVAPDGLTLADTVASGGIRPVSVTAHGDLLYVLNAGGTGNIAGFRVSAQGTLTAIAGSSRPLSSGAASAAQISFSPDGRQLVVTERATQKIDTYMVDRDGLATGPLVQNSAGVTPFGFAFAGRDQVIVSEAFGGAPNGSATSSYTLGRDGALSVVTASATTHQTAACWLVTTKNGKYAYAANAGSGSVTGYAIAQDGSLSLLNADGRTGVTGAGTTPIDEAMSNNSQFLYVLTAGAHGIAAFAVGADGSLTALDGFGGFPAGVAGIAAR
jgi:6-phosphogluconolactonase (cycloisomerase 2 family)